MNSDKIEWFLKNRYLDRITRRRRQHTEVHYHRSLIQAAPQLLLDSQFLLFCKRHINFIWSFVDLLSGSVPFMQSTENLKLSFIFFSSGNEYLFPISSNNFISSTLELFLIPLDVLNFLYEFESASKLKVW